MSDPTQRVHCEVHGETPAAFVCVHLLEGVGCGFHCSARADDPWPDAWCDACDASDDAHEPEIRLLCTGCHDTVRARNLYVPSPIAPGQLALSPLDYEALADACCERAKVRQEAATQRWGFGARERWAYDADAGVLRFIDGKGAVAADAIVCGSFSTTTHTWKWSWDNAPMPTASRALVGRVRTFGVVRGIEKLSRGQWEAEEVDGWEVTQIAADLLQADAIYRGPFDHLMVFFLLYRFREEPVA